MRTPSVKTLAQCFDDPKAAKRILRMRRTELLDLPAGYAYVAECYSPPSTAYIRMHCLNAIDPGLFGVESVVTEDEGECADYLNTGDMYAPTLIRWRGAYRVQSLGDFVETQERNGVRFK